MAHKNIDKNLTGTWHIYEMEEYDEDDFNMETQAYIKLKTNNSGNFEFANINGCIDGKMVRYSEGNQFEFNWEGAEEGQDISGSGWIKLKSKNIIKGELRFFCGEDTKFLARRAE